MTKPRGFAAMTPERQREIAAAGGRKAHASGRAHKFTADEAREAGRKGGVKMAAKPGHMAQIGRKGGAAVAQDRSHMAAIGKLGGTKVSQRDGHMSAMGRLGGEAIAKDGKWMRTIGKRGGATNKRLAQEREAAMAAELAERAAGERQAS